jgi:outer membrane lipoprotein-sorting protein
MRWLFFLLLIGLTGCIRPPEPVWTEIPTADQLLTKLASASGRYSSLDGAASVSLTTGDKFFSSQQFLLLQKPNRMRTDVLTGFGQLVLQMTSDGDNLSVLLKTTVPGRFLSGPASYENVSRFVRVPLATEDLLTLLLYDPPLIVHQRSRVDFSSDTLTLILSNSNNHQELLFDRQLQLIGSRYFKSGEQYLSVGYENFSGKDQFPYMIKISMPLEQTKVKVKFSELKVNENIDIAQFTLKKPANILLEPLP